MSDNLIYDVIGVGFGPANIAVAIAMEESQFKGNVLFLESHKHTIWQEHMLYDGSDIQNNPLRDLVTPRNPRSKYSFTNFLFEKDRLWDFLNTGLRFPHRIEYAQYVAWVAGHFKHLVQYNTRVVKLEVEPAAEPGKTLYRITDSDNRVYLSRTLIIAPGRTPYVPPVFADVMNTGRATHLTQYLGTLNRFPKESLKRIAVIGGSQSAVEIMIHLSDTYPDADVVGITKVYGYKQKDVNPFTGEVYFPKFVDTFYYAGKEEKRRLINDLHLTNYSASDADVLDRLYVKMYMQKVQGPERIFVHRSADILSARKVDAENISISFRKLEEPGKVFEENFSLVIIATGFRNIGTGEYQEPYPKIFNSLAPELVLDAEGCLKMNYDYSVDLKHGAGKSCFVNGLCESSHGMGDAGSFSLLALRSAQITNGIADYLNSFRKQPTTQKLTTHA